MSKKFTVITKDGSKWLRPVNPFDPRDIMWQEFNLKEPDLLYLGNHPEGTILDEREVREVRQYRLRGTDHWFHPNDSEYKSHELDIRTAYTDAESHGLYVFDEILNNTSGDAKMNVSLQMDLSYWKRRCEAAEKYIDESPCDPDITPAQEAAYNAWHEIVKQQPK